MAHSLFPLYEGAEERWAGTQEDWEGGGEGMWSAVPN